MSLLQRVRQVYDHLCQIPPWHDSQRMSQPFFIVGSGRSGNTLLRAFLMKIPGVYIPSETYVLGDIASSFRWWRFLPWPEVVRQVLATFEYYPAYRYIDVSLRELAEDLRALPSSQRSLAGLIDAVYRCWATSHMSGACRCWGDKTPWHVMWIPQIAKVFPGAKWVHMLRDGRDAALSYVESGLQPNLEAAAARWVRSVSAFEAFERGNNSSGSTHTVRYEQLLGNPEATLQELCAFLDLPYSPDMLDHTGQKNLGDVHRQAHHAMVHRPLNASNIAKWAQQDTATQDRLNKLLGPTLKRWGYRD